jgi:MAF protein
MKPGSHLPVVLGSSSPFRKTILEKLRIDFETASPDINESALDDESPKDLVKRLSEQKAQAVAKTHKQHLIIASDQVAVLDDQVMGKPGNHENAFQQLKQASGHTVTFLTGLCLLNSQTGKLQSEVVPFDVVFRTLTDDEIDHYLELEQPYQCAGSFKSEGLGIALFERLEGDDPNTLMGLPLIALVRMLRNESVKII